MIRIKLTTSFPEFPIYRQTPRYSGIWLSCEFFCDREVEDCDFWVVYEDLLRPDRVFCPPENTIFITGEPPQIKSYNQSFLEQFGIVITFRRDIQHPNKIITQSAMPWHVGRKVEAAGSVCYSKDYDELISMQSFQKENLLSIITSAKAFTEGHRKRLEFASLLKEHFGHRVHIFGRGIHEIADKWDAIAPYKYHIALENCMYPDYFTEKLSDAFLGGSYPFYYGAPNISEYFSEKSLTPINISNPFQAIDIIENKIQECTYEKSIVDILHSRNLVLNRYNLFALIHQIVNPIRSKSMKEFLLLKPERYFKHS